MLKEALGLLSLVVAALVLTLLMVVVQLVPASVWLKVDEVRVFDAKVGEPILMAVRRTIVNDFDGRWVSNIRRLEPNGWVSFCPSSGANSYQINTELPVPLTMKWWTFPYCDPLPAGKYQMRTVWTVVGTRWLPDKQVRADSNIFEIKP